MCRAQGLEFSWKVLPSPGVTPRLLLQHHYWKGTGGDGNGASGVLLEPVERGALLPRGEPLFGGSPWGSLECFVEGAKSFYEAHDAAGIVAILVASSVIGADLLSFREPGDLVAELRLTPFAARKALQLGGECLKGG